MAVALPTPSYVTPAAISSFVRHALNEDVGDGDHTSLAVIPETESVHMRLLAKDEGIVAGVELARRIFLQEDPRGQFEVIIDDGQPIRPGNIVFTANGTARSLLTVERLILNCMQRMSGIATNTHRLCGLLEGTGTKLMDTRKTTPGFRMMEKWAVFIGGGVNHRFGLFDKIMIKDNHVDIAGGIATALTRAKDYVKRTGKNLEIEVEARSLDEVREVLRIGGASTILLDNMSAPQLKEAVGLVKGACRTEASGGITEKNLRDVALTGVDYVSMGALTHSVRSLDLSLKVIRK